jgi:AraC-like DNA-binding protein/quercetin dioxygenase-like cupin family protein
MHDLSLYEKKIITDDEFPVQMFENQFQIPGEYCSSHWHEHLELHYILKGTGIFHCNQKTFEVKEESLVIINSNELHKGISNTNNFHSLVIIFEIGSFSKEIANCNVIFQSIIHGDAKIEDILMEIYKEENDKGSGFKLAIKGKLYELITYLFRNYVKESLTVRENNARIWNLGRLNTVISYIQENYAHSITNKELSDLIHVSEYRFSHLFKESMGISPLNYINEVRLKKAYLLLEKKENSISEIAEAVGFSDYNNFGRLFRKYYGFPPSKVFNETARLYV